MNKTHLLLFLCLLSTLFSCRKNTPDYRIGVSQCSDDAWRSRLNDEMIREAWFYENIDIEIRTANDNNAKQQQDIREFIDKKVDLLIVAPNEAAPITTAVEEAMNSGIPVIVIDRKILSDKYTAYIGADNYEIGKEVGNYLAARLNGKGNILEICGLSGSSPATERHLGFMSAISKYPDIKLIANDYAGWLQEPSRMKTDTLLQLHDRVDAIFAQNDRMAYGAYQAACQQQRNQEIVFVGIDALPGEGNGIELVRNGILDATFLYPTNGNKVIQTAMDILTNGVYQRETILHTAIVNQQNAQVMHLQNMHIAELDEKIRKLNNKVTNYLVRYSNQKAFLYGSLLALTVVIALMTLLFRSLKIKNRINRELSSKKKKLEEQRDQLVMLSNQLEEATHAKLMFFTNISHDFRTPLTLISDPVERLLSEKELSEDAHKLLSLVKKNVGILLRLVNQILDFRKYENGKMEFHPITLDLKKSVSEWNVSFEELARKKEIRFLFEYEPDETYCMQGDVEKLERIYFNLLSNALKFTPVNGKITVRFSRREGQLTLEITNTGSLISAEHIRNIFDRFYQIDSHHSGSGIGLALTKAFVELHGGSISVESDLKTGTTFRILFTAIDPEPQQPSFPMDAEVSSLLPEEFEYNEEEMIRPADDNGRETILIIDDNTDIRSYIRQAFEQEYTILEAADGQEGIQKAMKQVPDLIISDVMMPGMDGLTCCKHLKSQIQTSHIPIILLTACALEEQRISGYDGGADSYISKPFSIPLLIARVKNLMESRRRIRQIYGDQTESSKEQYSDLDRDFIAQFKQVIENHLSESDLNIDKLTKEMGMSRVQLYRKVKSLTNYAPNEYIRVIRLKKAASLLSSTGLTITEVGYQVGFSSPSYFTKCYRDFFGMSPSDFVKKKNGDFIRCDSPC